MELKQQNFSSTVSLEDWSSENHITTGIMTECVSVIFFLENGKRYGIHCGGGITGGWPEKLRELIQKKDACVKNMHVIFGQSYKDEKEVKSMPYKIDGVIDEFPGIDIVFLCGSDVKVCHDGSHNATTQWQSKGWTDIK